MVSWLNSMLQRMKRPSLRLEVEATDSAQKNKAAITPYIYNNSYYIWGCEDSSVA